MVRRLDRLRKHGHVPAIDSRQLAPIVHIPMEILRLNNVHELTTQQHLDGFIFLNNIKK